jgi:regulator of replication initiation timing
MISKTICSAAKLVDLQPHMIRSVVTKTEFEAGTNYHRKDRIRILDSDAGCIKATVVGRLGTYAQCVRLKDGLLIAECTCQALQGNICRHCIGVLLAFIQRPGATAMPQTPRQQQEESTREHPVGGTPAIASVTLLDLNTFVDWIDSTASALSHGEFIPEPPELSSRVAQGWVKAVEQMEAYTRRLAAERKASQEDLQARETQISRLTSQLNQMGTELNQARSQNKALQEELSQVDHRLAEVNQATAAFRACGDGVQAIVDSFNSRIQDLQQLRESVLNTCQQLERLSPRNRR